MTIFSKLFNDKYGLQLVKVIKLYWFSMHIHLTGLTLKNPLKTEMMIGSFLFLYKKQLMKIHKRIDIDLWFFYGYLWVLVSFCKIKNSLEIRTTCLIARSIKV